MPRHFIGLNLVAGLLLAVCVLALAAAAGPSGSAAATSAEGSVSLLYAGSLVDVMTNQIIPSFQSAGGGTVNGLPAGSTELASEVKNGLQRADVFVSASPKVNGSLMGTANGAWVSWYGEFASAPLVIAYNPKSKYAADFKKEPWYKVLGEHGIRIGRTDPKLDPKGKLTIEFMNAFQKVGHRPGIAKRLIGSAENQAQIFPEQSLLGRLDAGQLDVGFFYSIEAVAAKLPYVAPALGAHYGARYTVTIPRGGANPVAALDFVDYLLGPAGTRILKQDGFKLLNGEVGGDRRAAPASVRALLGAPVQT
jgi:molybdate/tungstate transport system substrate-binding protein